MCGRYSLAAPGPRVRLREQEVAVACGPRYNVAPGQTAPVIRRESDIYAVSNLRWGLVPSWAKESKIGYGLINARAETVSEKAGFRTAFRQRRCVVPADGFFEWQHQGRVKLPWRFVLADNAPFVFAGLWETWRPLGEASRSEETFTIVTTTPNDLVARVHDRMPVILDSDAAAVWLDSSADPLDLRQLLQPCRADRLRSYRVSPIVNSGRIDSAECIKPISESEFPRAELF